MAENIAITFDDLPCIDAGELLRQAPGADLPVHHVANRANSFRCPLGPAPGRGWFLLPRISLQTILGGESFSSYFTHTARFYAGAVTIALSPMIPVRATGVTILKDRQEQEAAWLLEVADKRILGNMSTIAAQYNVRRPQEVLNSRLFYTPTLNSNDPWTWTTMLQDIWSKLPSQVFGSSLPTLPNVGFLASPENWRFFGISAWQALNLVLEYLGFAVAYNPTNDTFSIVQQGVDHAASSTTLEEEDFNRRVWDGAGLNYDRTTFPQTIRCYFKKLKWGYGDDATQPSTSDAWQLSPFHTVDNPTDVLAAIPGTVLGFHEDLVAYYDQAGTLLNTSEINLRASDRRYLFLRNRGNNNRSSEAIGFTTDTGTHRAYSGLLSLAPTSRITGVAWRNYGDGIKTEVLRRNTLVRDVIDDWGLHRDEHLAQETNMAPDLARWHVPYTRFAWARTIGSIGANSSGTVQIIYKNNALAWVDATATVTAYDIFAEAVAANKRIWLAWHQQSGQWHIIQAQC